MRHLWVLGLVVLTACPPVPPHVDQCTPLTNRCYGEVLELCSPQQRWRPEMDCRTVEDVVDGGRPGTWWCCPEPATGRMACLPEARCGGVAL